MRFGHPSLKGTGKGHHDEGYSVGLLITVDDRTFVDDPRVSAYQGIPMRFANKGNAVSRRSQKGFVPIMLRGHRKIDRQAAAAHQVSTRVFAIRLTVKFEVLMIATRLQIEAGRKV